MFETMCRTLRRGFTPFLVAGAVVVSGCATGPQQTSGRPLTPDEQRLRQQADVYNETVIEGAIVGAVAGALLGVLITGDARGAAVGAGAGALVGGGAGAYMAEKQKQYSNEEQRLDAITADIRAENQRAGDVVASARKVISADKATIAEIDRKLGSGQINMEQARQQMASVDDNKNYLQTTITNLKNKKEEWSAVAAQARSQGTPQQMREMDGEIKKLEQQIASLETDLDSLVETRRISKV